MSISLWFLFDIIMRASAGYAGACNLLLNTSYLTTNIVISKKIQKPYYRQTNLLDISPNSTNIVIYKKIHKPYSRYNNTLDSNDLSSSIVIIKKIK